MLSNRDIRARLTRGDLVIDPLPPDSAFGGASVDLTLWSRIGVVNSSRCGFFDYRALKANPHYLPSITDPVDLEDQPLILHPGRVVICSTAEWIKVPPDLCAELHGRSTLARLGVLPHTAGKVDPGWDGRLTLEVSNLGEIPVALYPGDSICQIVFHELSSPADLSRYSRYQGQSGPQTANYLPDVWEEWFGFGQPIQPVHLDEQGYRRVHERLGYSKARLRRALSKAGGQDEFQKAIPEGYRALNKKGFTFDDILALKLYYNLPVNRRARAKKSASNPQLPGSEETVASS